jgi:hypothetical protein
MPGWSANGEFPHSREFSKRLVTAPSGTCSCRSQYTRCDSSVGEGNGPYYKCVSCSNAYFDESEKQNKLELTPIRVDKIEEHTNHIESKITALETEINEIAKTTKTYSETTHTDITTLNSRVDMLSEQLKTTNSRIDEIFLVFKDIKNMFSRYNNIVDIVEKQISTPKMKELTE